RRARRDPAARGRDRRHRSGPGLMRATSQASLRNASEAWEQVLRQAGADAAGYGGQLFAVVDALDRSAGLRRALTEPTRDGEAKAARAAELRRGKVAEPVLDLVSGMARSRWSADGDQRDRAIPDTRSSTGSATLPR